MAYTKASMKAVDRYVKKNYDSYLVRVPSGQKAAIQAAADKAGESVNQYTNTALLPRMGLTEWPEKAEE